MAIGSSHFSKATSYARAAWDAGRASRDAEVQALKESIKILGDQLEFDRSAVADGVTAIKRAVDGRNWLTEGRGPYEWNDDNWHDEFRSAAVEILDAVDPLAKIAADWKGCPQTTEGVIAARIDLGKKLDAAREQAQRISELLDAAANGKATAERRLSAVCGERDVLRKSCDDLNGELERHSTDRVNQREQVKVLRDALGGVMIFCPTSAHFKTAKAALALTEQPTEKQKAAIRLREMLEGLDNATAHFDITEQPTEVMEDEHGECPNCANPPHAGPCHRKQPADLAGASALPPYPREET